VNVFSRGLKSVYRNKARSLIIIFLLGVCLSFSMAMLAVRMAANSQVDDIKTKVGNYAEVRISSQFFFNKYFEERSKSEGELSKEARGLSEEEARAEREDMLVSEQITDDVSLSDYIRTYDKFLTAGLTLPAMENASLIPVFERGLQKEMARLGIDLTANTFAFTGNTDAASLSDFREGKKELIQGRLYDYFDYRNANPVVLIEKNLAEKNGLGVGSTIEAEVNDKSGREAILELTVVGIYEAKEAERTTNPLGNFNPSGNRFYAPLSLVQKLNNTPDYVDTASYYFDTVDHSNALLTFFRGISGSDKLEMYTNIADYQTLADPLSKVGNTSSIALWGSLGACALILLLAMLLIVRGRVKELGVLKAVGAADRQILGQLAFEVVGLCLVAVIIATIMTAIFGQGLGNWMIKGNRPVEESTQNGGQDGAGVGQMLSQLRGGGAPAEAAGESSAGREIQVLFTSKLFLFGALMLLGICLLGMVVPVIGVIRLRPAVVLRME